MSNPILVNLRQAFLNAPGFWESSPSSRKGNWCKLVYGLDKNHTDGYSLEGSFVSQLEELAYQQPGLYLSCEQKGRKKQGNQQRLYYLFLLEAHGEVTILKEFKSASKEWAVPLWPEIEAYLHQQTNSAEIRRQELLTKIQALEFELSQLRAELAVLEMDQLKPTEEEL
ncbi:hypothetical protein [Lyngbya aestuarii]|uniref:hypothetical protein n=1 Tax=Lyngbya aestuarii TaxID=118322 RepID=UPI00403DC070